jgi:hypothetical protein
VAQSPIDASQIPVPDLDAGVLSVDAGFLSSDAGALRSAGADVRSSWAGLAGVYHAPEAADLLSVMDPVATSTDSFASDAQKVASILQTFAEEAGPLAATLASTQSQATAFAQKISGNDKWDHSSSLVNENNAMVHAVNTTICAYQAAERKAANAIEALIGGQQWHVANPNSNAKDPYAYGYSSIPDNAKTPWGADVSKKSGCLSSTLHGVGQFFVGVGEGAWGMVKGLGTLAWDAVGGGGWAKFKQAWQGIAFLGTLVIPGGNLAGMAIWGPKGYSDRLIAMGKGLIDWDDWKSDPGKAAGESAFNILTLAIPGADGASAAGDGAKAAELAADAGDAASTASKVSKVVDLTKTGLQTFAKYTDPFTYVGKLPKVLDLANSLKIKFPDFAGGGDAGSNLDHTMGGWDHAGTHTDPAPGISDHTPEPAFSHAGTHTDTPGTIDHPGMTDHPVGTGHSGEPPTNAAGDHRPEYTGADGKQHYAGDPPDTSRDPQGGLHGPNGHYVHDPNAPVNPGTNPIQVHHEYSAPATTHDVSAGEKAGYDAKVEQRNEFQQQHQADLAAQSKALAALKQHGIEVPARDLAGSHLSDTIARLNRTTSDPAVRAEIQQLRDSSVEANLSMAHLKASSEGLGMTAGSDVITSGGGHVIVGAGTDSGKAGELDLIGLSHDGKTLTVVEAKGGASTLGSRLVDGVRAEQGSSLYLNDLLHRDPRFLQYLDQHPDFARQLADGKIHIDYDLVRAAGSGQITVRPFTVDPGQLDLGDLAPSTPTIVPVSGS